MVLRSRLNFWQRVAYSWGTILVLVIVIGILAHGTFQLYRKNAKATERRDIALMELHAVETRKAGLEAELTHINTTAGIEAELRHKFDVAREGEHLLVVVDKEIVPNTPPREQGFFEKLRGFWDF